MAAMIVLSLWPLRRWYVHHEPKLGCASCLLSLFAPFIYLVDQTCRFYTLFLYTHIGLFVVVCIFSVLHSAAIVLVGAALLLLDNLFRCAIRNSGAAVLDAIRVGGFSPFITRLLI
jgi:hypothetical protein